MDTPGLFDEVDDKASEKKMIQKVQEIERKGIEDQIDEEDLSHFEENNTHSVFAPNSESVVEDDLEQEMQRELNDTVVDVAEKTLGKEYKTIKLWNILGQLKLMGKQGILADGFFKG